MEKFEQIFRPNLNLLAKRLLAVLIFYQISRFGFYVTNLAFFSKINPSLFFFGIMYDLSAIASTNLIFAPLHLAPWKLQFNEQYQKIVKFLFFLTNLTFIATNFIDFEYFKFTGRRSFFSMILAKESKMALPGLIPSFLKSFWHIPASFIIFSILFWFCLGAAHTTKQPKQKNTPQQQIRATLMLCVIITLGIILARGGLGRRPLREIDGLRFSNVEHLSLVLNTPFTIIRNLNKFDQEKITFPPIPSRHKTSSIPSTPSRTQIHHYRKMS
jgi:hypothetical protein